MALPALRLRSGQALAGEDLTRIEKNTDEAMEIKTSVFLSIRD